MLKVGIVGIGFMGWIHTLAYRRAADAKVVAYCEQNTKRLAGDWTDIKGNFGPPGEQIDMQPYACYEDFAKLLADPNVDLVDICLPPGAHAKAAIAALEAGKHVFCEKPIALHADDAQKMVETAKKVGKQLFIGHVLPFTPEYAFAQQVAVSGKYGKLLGGNFKRVISDPLWIREFYNPDIAGGPMLDLHVHDAHYIRLLFGMPASVVSTGRMRGEVAEFFTSQFQFADPSLCVSATSGCLLQQGRSFTHAYEIYFEKATLMFDFAVFGGEGVTSLPFTVLTEDGKVERPTLEDGDPVHAFIKEMDEVARCVKAGSPSEILDAKLACDALKLCEAQTESIKERKAVEIK